MYFKRKSQLIKELILITTFTTTVCDNLPKYCQCIESKGNRFSAFAKYSIESENQTEFWLYQNKHRCKMFVKNKEEIEIDTSGQIQYLNDIYRQWSAFYFENIVYECRTYSFKLGLNLIECQHGNEKWHQIYSFNSFKDFNTTLAFAERIHLIFRQDLSLTKFSQSISEGIWLRSAVIESYEMKSNNNQTHVIFKKSVKLDESLLQSITREINDSLYINAFINAIDSNHNTKGFFIFVTTHKGIPFYCFKKKLTESTDRCKIENLKPFMSECYSTTETTHEITTGSETSFEIPMTSTERQAFGSDLPLVWILIAIIIVSILCSIPCFICLIIEAFNTKESKSQTIGDKNNRKNGSVKVGKEPKIYPKYLSETQVSKNSKIESKSESEKQLTKHPFSVHSKKGLQKSSVDSIERPVDLIIRQK